MRPLLITLRLIALTGVVACGAGHTARQETAPPARQTPAPPAPPAPAPPEPKQGGEWRPYAPPDKSFSVELPCDPEQTNVSASSTPIYEYSCGGEDASGIRFFLVSVLNLSDAERAKMRDAAAFERSVRDSFTPNQKVLRLTPIHVEGGIGREVVTSNTTDNMDNGRGRVIIYGGRRYDVTLVATDVEELESATAERFFASFKPR